MQPLRQGNAAELAAALQASRADTLATFAAGERALPELALPLRDELNPPLWELGHIGWFQEWWLARNPERCLGLAPTRRPHARQPARAGADALYNSSRVPHDTPLEPAAAQ
jgi:iron(II)-dependent oxidoreductase